MYINYNFLSAVGNIVIAKAYGCVFCLLSSPKQFVSCHIKIYSSINNYPSVRSSAFHPCLHNLSIFPVKPNSPTAFITNNHIVLHTTPTTNIVVSAHKVSPWTRLLPGIRPKCGLASCRVFAELFTCNSQSLLHPQRRKLDLSPQPAATVLLVVVHPPACAPQQLNLTWKAFCSLQASTTISR